MGRLSIARASLQRTDGWRPIRHQRRTPRRRSRPTVLLSHPTVDAKIAALARLLARQAAREHLHRLVYPDAGDTTDET
jgi:hypothetical protein